MSIKKDVPQQDLNVKMISWFDDHYYRLELRENEVDFFPSVTTKLGIISKPFLARWRGDVGNIEADRRLHLANVKGSRIHDAWYMMNQGGLIIFNPFNRPNYNREQIEEFNKQYSGRIRIIEDQQEMVELHRLRQWVDIVKPEFVESEKIVYSIKRREAGTMDNLIRVKAGEYMVNGSTPVILQSGLYVLDVKTGGYDDDNYELQIAAYAVFYEEMRRKKVRGTIIVRTNAQTKKGIAGLATYVKTRKEVTYDFKSYCYAADLWNRKEGESSKPKIFEFPSLISLPREVEAL